MIETAKAKNGGNVPADARCGWILSEIVRLDGTREGLSDADLEKFIESFPAERV